MLNPAGSQIIMYNEQEPPQITNDYLETLKGCLGFPFLLWALLAPKSYEKAEKIIERIKKKKAKKSD